MVVSRLGGSSLSSLSTSLSCIALTDGDVQAVHLLAQNLQNPFNEISSRLAKAHLLLWGDDPSSHPGNTNFDDWCRREWNTAWEEGESVQFDILLAGDVLYKEELPKLFFETVQRYMAWNPPGVLWLCHVPRASVSHEVVVAASQKAGFEIELRWKYEDDSDSFRVEGSPMEDLKRARVYKITAAPA